MEQFNYLFLILIWAGPVIVLQWLVGLDVLIKRWKVWIPGILIPTLYLTAMDSLPLASKTWTINPAQSTGILIPLINVPIEEGIFFLATNTLVVQGFIFVMNFRFLWNRILNIARLIRRGPAAWRSNAGLVDQPKETDQRGQGV